MLALPAIEPAGSWHAVVVAIALLGELLSVVFVYRVLVRGGSPASTLLWMVVILAAPWIGLLLYYLLPRRLQLRRLRRMRTRGARVRGWRSRDATAAAAEPARPGLASLLAGTDGFGLVAGNELTWLPTGEQFLAAATAAILGARRHVHCVVYIFRPDAAGLQFLALLTRASRNGTAVRLLYDAIGSFGLEAAHLAPLRAAGGRAESFMPLLWRRRPFTVNLRNHRKLLVVDGEVAFLGGRNIGNEYFTDRTSDQRVWLDAMLGLRGPVVDRLQDVFVEDWCTATEEVLADTFTLPQAVGADSVGIVCSGPDREESDLWFAVVQAIGEAEHSIELNSPYLLLPSTLLFALQLAAARGVAVCVATNGQPTEAAILYHAQRSHYRKLLAAGIQVFESIDEYNHAKVLVVDGKTAVIGSANMDLRSAHLNFEIAAVVIDAPRFVSEVLATLAARRQRFRRISRADLPSKPLSRALDALCGLLSPIL